MKRENVIPAKEEMNAIPIVELKSLNLENSMIVELYIQPLKKHTHSLM